jgi:predicted nucleotidyltransferase
LGVAALLKAGNWAQHPNRRLSLSALLWGSLEDLLCGAGLNRAEADLERHNPNMHSTITDMLGPHGPVVSAVRSRFPNAMAIYAFGSQVQGIAGPQSDLDLAVLVAGYADPLVLWDMAGHLADVVGCAVDLLDLRAASTVMQYQVITTGQRLWSVGIAAGLFETFVLSEKTALDEARAPLMADIQRTGKIHGR